LMIDLFAELIPVLALTRDPPAIWLMESKPRDVNQHILNRPVIIDVLLAGALMGLIAFVTYILYFIFHGLSLRGIHTTWISYMTATTVTYTSIVFCQYISLLFRRVWSDESIFTSYLRSNKKLLRAFLMSFVGVLMLIYVPVVRDFFAFGSMRLVDWIFPLTWGLVFLTVYESNKRWKRMKTRKQVTVVESTQLVS
jgi:Ca2+-transporting ATPase